MIALGVRSNAGSVRLEVEEFAAGQPFAAEVFQEGWGGKTWPQWAKWEAERALYRMAEGPFEEALVPRFVRTVTALVMGGAGGAGARMLWSMEDGRKMASEGEVRAAVEKSHVAPLWHEAAKGDRKEVWGVIKEWVRAGRASGGDRERDDPGKGKVIEAGPGGRDEGESDEAIAQRIFWILFGPERGKVAEAREGLIRGVGGYAAATLGSAGAKLGEEKAERWLWAVLEAWETLVKRELGRALAGKLGEKWRGRG